MKRTALHRRTPLRKRSRRARPRPTDEQIAAKHHALCWLAQFSERPCSGQIRLAHLIRKERLYFYGVPAESIWDDRVLVHACDAHHTQLDDVAIDRLEVPRQALPAELEEFAAEHSLTFLLGRNYGAIDDIQTAPAVDWPEEGT